MGQEEEGDKMEEEEEDELERYLQQERDCKLTTSPTTQKSTHLSLLDSSTVQCILGMSIIRSLQVLDI